MYYFIVNESGGSGKGVHIWRQIKALLSEQGIDYKAYRTEDVGDATRLAGRISEQPDDDIRLVVLGGDGTINEVLNGITDFDRVRFGVVPVGSANDFVTGMGLPRDPVTALANLISDRPERRMDIGRVLLPDDTARIFGISAGIGMDAIVCKRALTSRLKTFLNKLGLGSATYVLLTILTLFDMELVPVHISLTDGEETIERDIPKLVFAAGMNMPIEGGGVAMAPDAGYDDGRLTLCTGFGVHGFTAAAALVKILTHRHMCDDKHFIVRDFTRLTLTSERPMVVHTDGEYAGDVTRLVMEILPGKLRLL